MDEVQDRVVALEGEVAALVELLAEERAVSERLAVVLRRWNGLPDGGGGGLVAATDDEVERYDRHRAVADGMIGSFQGDGVEHYSGSF